MIRVKVNNLSKKFDLDIAHNNAALAQILHLLHPAKYKRERHVLQRVSAEICAGEIMGLIGRNGSGKTTLLRLMGGIYLPDEGCVETHGNVVYLSAFTQALIPKLTMRENIELIGALRGLSAKEVYARFDTIVDFSGLRDYVDVKTYQFSKGMTNRLAFSTTIYCIENQHPDILLIDEALSTSGDIDFQEKAMLKMGEYIKSGATVILASHSMNLVMKYCHRVMLIENGRIQKIGEPQDVVNFYVASSGSKVIPAI